MGYFQVRYDFRVVNYDHGHRYDIGNTIVASTKLVVFDNLP